MVRSAIVRPYVDTNWLHHFEATHDVVFNDRALIVEDSADLLKVGAGFNAQLTPTLSSYLAVEWGTDLDGERYRSLGGTFGVRILW
ncbi:autotransporter outer membrane beta-barrel domain-containing protein [Brevundimonas sp.]|uniref:autotransporter outer membrane beta-barrel domain-containing protein n=1 Tax=Brevundimonas sp. TaxID=1871086 RepID=UPI003D6C8266